jgi:hypothetical protein
MHTVWESPAGDHDIKLTLVPRQSWIRTAHPSCFAPAMASFMIRSITSVESKGVRSPADGQRGVGQLQQAQKRCFVCVTSCCAQLDYSLRRVMGFHGWLNDGVLRSAATSI